MPARKQGKAAPDAGLSTERVVAEAIRIADRDGLHGLSMRGLAGALGAGAMSLYYYVANKDELLDAMIDVVFAEIELPATDTDWQTAMRTKIPMGRFGDLADLDGMAIFLASGASAYVTGQCFPVDGGFLASI
mgnify:CR=1 FL=1